MKRAFIVFMIMLVFAPTCACAAETGTERLSVVATIFPEYDFARAVSGGLCDVEMLIKPGAESHSYEPTPMDIITIQNCDVFICIGGESDVWAQTILDSVDASGITVVRLMDIVDALEEEITENMTVEEEEAHGEIEYDEHVWTSPVNAMAIVAALSETLCSLDEANSAAYRENAEAYIGQIAIVDSQIRELVAGAKRTELVFGDRFPFLYFAREYGLAFDAAYPGCASESEASAATVAGLIRKVEETDVPAVLYIELSAHRIADMICEATGAKELLLHSCHNVTREEFNANETYVTLMTKNLTTLKEALY